MKRKFWIALLSCLAAFSLAQADQSIESVQQKLKDQGFYYGQINGKKDADTTAAIRRYQIRNGLQVTGELNVETKKSLNGSATAAATPSPRPASSPASIRSETKGKVVTQEPARIAPPPDETDNTEYAPNPYSRSGPGLRIETGGVFAGTPFETAPPDVQRRAILDAQMLLARRGYYRSGIDGIYGAGMDFALRAYQSRAGIPPTGRLDMDTLASLGLLPGEQAPGFGQPRVRIFPRRFRIGPTGERVYIPN